MDFSLSETQEQLVGAVGRWVERRWADGESDLSAAAVRRARWSELSANGWTGLLSPPAMPVLDAALMVERFAYGGCTLPVGPGALVAPFVAAAAGLGVSPGIDQLCVLDGAHHPDAPSASAARGLELADRVVVLASAPGPGGRRWSAGAVPVGPDAITVVQDEGRTVLSRLAAFPARSELAPLDRVMGELAWLLGAVLSAAELVGLARAVLDSCVAYAKVRIQGGKPIGGHQAVQHRLVDMLGHVERARYLTYLAATALSGTSEALPADGVVREVHQAKALAARDCVAAIRSGHQVMGAISFSAEHDLHHFHKQAVVAAHEFGGASWHWAALEGAARALT
ncbi:MAG: acyl-CoA dehydrogenase family protein [Acidimicrobiales bacterium]